MKYGKRKTSITIPEYLYNQIQEKAKNLDVSVSACITLLIKGEISLERNK